VAFRSYVNIDWLRIFDDCSNNVESMWNKLKDMLLNGTTLFTLYSNSFMDFLKDPSFALYSSFYTPLLSVLSYLI